MVDQLQLPPVRLLLPSELVHPLQLHRFLLLGRGGRASAAVRVLAAAQQHRAVPRSCTGGGLAAVQAAPAVPSTVQTQAAVAWLQLEKDSQRHQLPSSGRAPLCQGSIPSAMASAWPAMTMTTTSPIVPRWSLLS